jgi:hypothetical protein
MTPDVNRGVGNRDSSPGHQGERASKCANNTLTKTAAEEERAQPICLVRCINNLRFTTA